MCVPESALRFYEEELDRAYIAQEHGFETYEEYLDSLKDDIGNRQYDEMKERT